MKGETPTLKSLLAGKAGKAGDDDLRHALAESAAEARLASMSEEQLVEAAIAQSLKEQSSDKHSRDDTTEETGTHKNVTGKRKAAEDDEQVGANQVARHNPPHPLFAVTSGKEAQSPMEPLSMDAFDERQERVINRLQGSLDLLFCKGWIKKQARARLHDWMLNELAWHRVTYVRPGTNIRIVTPRFTATFGKDDTGAPDSAYRVAPKPFPAILAALRDTLEAKTSSRFNAIIINYYADGLDSISYHSDDEAFLGPRPTIASISLGASRDFYLRRKAPADEAVPVPLEWQKMGTKGKGPAATRPTEKMVLDSGDLLVMRGNTQAEWEHSIPKRAKHVAGRINMTFRRVINVSGTNNFIRYNRVGDGDGGVYRWNAQQRKMLPGVGGL